MSKLPELDSTNFICPHCGIHSQQIWAEELFGRYTGPDPNGQIEFFEYELQDSETALCANCKKYSLWIGGKMVYPITGNVVIPNQDLPPEVLSIYNEAKNVVNISPRSSAALLRLALQQLLKHLGESGSNLNSDISKFVKKYSLPIEVQQALDSIRVIGNHAVHPGEIDLNGNTDDSKLLFNLINFICDTCITQRRKIAELYGNLPQKDRENIAKRDGSASAPASE